MKKCPRCQTDYFDNMLDFCLEDGARLISVDDEPPKGNPPGRTILQESPPTDQSTLAFTAAFGNLQNDSAAEIETIAVERNSEKKNVKKAQPTKDQNSLNFDSQKVAEKIKHRALGHWTSFLETAPLVVALAHNYWQWLYLSKLSYGGFLEYFLSSSFLLWLLLLLSGLILSIISLKYARSLKFAVVSLVVLAINVLLYIVPK